MPELVKIINLGMEYYLQIHQERGDNESFERETFEGISQQGLGKEEKKKETKKMREEEKRHWEKYFQFIVLIRIHIKILLGLLIVLHESKQYVPQS